MNRPAGMTRGRLVAAGAALILLANAVALGGAAYNRSGSPEAVLPLSQRELALPYDGGFEGENSGLSLRLSWRTRDEEADTFGPGARPGWLGRDKLRELGFDIPDHLDAPETPWRAEQHPARAVLVVLELDGPAYRQSVAAARQALARQAALLAASPGNADARRRVEQAQRELEGEEREYSRLFAVDAGLDRAALRAKYPDRGRHAIVRGLVRPYLLTLDGRFRVGGGVTRIDVDSLHIPLPYSRTLDRLRHARGPADDGAPRYTLQVAFGQRLEPWVTAVSSPLPSATQAKP